MTRVAGRLARLERLTGGQHPVDRTWMDPPAEWMHTVLTAVATVLETMRRHRAERVVSLLNGGPAAWMGDPITLRVMRLALDNSPRAELTWFPMSARAWFTIRSTRVSPLALPESVCQVLDEHPRASFSYVLCSACGYASGDDYQSDTICQEHTHARATVGRSLFARCQLCDGMLGSPYFWDRRRNHFEREHGATNE